MIIAIQYPSWMKLAKVDAIPLIYTGYRARRRTRKGSGDGFKDTKPSNTNRTC